MAYGSRRGNREEFRKQAQGFNLSMGMSRLTRDGTAEPVSRETNFSGANGDREILIFLVHLTTSRIGKLARLIHTLAICDDHT